MKFINKPGTNLLLGCAVAGAFSQALAQTGSTNAAGEQQVLEKVVISASLLDKDINRITQSVSVVTEEKIKEQGFTDFTEVLRQEVGFEFKKAGGPGQFNYLKLRGLSTSNILLVMDGVKMNQASSGDIGNLIGQIDPNTVERVEILRGPQAVLYGANSTAGVISITTKSGLKPEALIALEGGSLKWRKGTASYRDNTAIGGGKLVYSLNLSGTDSGGVNKYEFYKDQSIQGKLGYISGNIEAGLSFWSTDNKFGYAELSEAYCCQTPQTYWSFQTPDPDQFSDTKEKNLGAYLRHTINENFKQELQLGGMKRRYGITDGANGLLGYQSAPFNNFSFGGATYAAGAPVPVRDTASSVQAYYEDTNQQANYNLIYSKGSLSGLLGFESLDQKAKQWGSYGTTSAKTTVRSYYLNGALELMPQSLDLAVGARLDDYNPWGRKTTGNVGLAYHFDTDATAFVNYGTSFAAPTTSQLFNLTYGNPGLTPQSGKTVEAGFRQRLMRSAAQWSATAWHTEISNVIAFDSTIANPRAFSGFGAYGNRDKQKTQGVELEASYDLSMALALTGNYTYTDSRISDAKGVFQRTVQIAYNKLNLGLNYHEEKFSAGANLYYTGPRLRWAGDVKTGGYTRLDVSGRYAITKALSTYIRVENLLDHNIVEEVGYKQAGLYGIAGLEYRFR